MQYVSAFNGSLRWVCSVHLPHSDNTDEEFDEAIRDLSKHCRQRQHEEAVFIGDFNAEPTSRRAALLNDVFSSFGYVCLQPSQAT